MEITAIELDLAKSWFQVHGADAQGRPLLRKKLTRGKLLAFFAKPAAVPRSGWRPAAAPTTGPAS